MGIANRIASETHGDLATQLKWIADTYKSDDDKTYIGGRYKPATATAQLKAVQEALTAAGFAAPAGGEEEKKEEGKEEEKKEEAEMEGGDEGEAAEGAEGMGDMMAAASDPYAGDETDYNGFANLPKLLLKQSIVNPYFGDLLKRAAVTWEFNYEGTQPDKMWMGAAGLLGATIDASESEAGDVWFAGYCGEADLESLKEMS